MCVCVCARVHGCVHGCMCVSVCMRMHVCVFEGNYDTQKGWKICPHSKPSYSIKLIKSKLTVCVYTFQIKIKLLDTKYLDHMPPDVKYIQERYILVPSLICHYY